VVDGATDVSPEARETDVAAADDTVMALSGQVGALRSVVADLVSETRRRRDPSLSENLHDCYEKLIQTQVSDEIAADLVRKVRAELPESQRADSTLVRKQLADFVASMLPIAGPLPKRTGAAGPLVIALVGPTGAGKTTTIAKLAANHRLREGQKVALITIDTYRIGAVDQLRTYADIINVPLKVVTTPKQMVDACTSFGDCDVVFIDTAGRSQNDADGLENIKRLLGCAKPDEVHLVLSTTASLPVLQGIMDKFDCLGVNRVIFTKLDEAVGFGVILSCLAKAEAKLSYVTTGQSVPDDIEVGRGGRLANLIVGPVETDLRVGAVKSAIGSAKGA